MFSQAYEKRAKALKLLDRKYECYSQEDKSFLHHNLMWTMEALQAVGLMEFVGQSDETS